MTPEEKKAKTQEILMVRGIAAALQQMPSPTVESLNNLLKTYGFEIVKTETKTN